MNNENLFVALVFYSLKRCDFCLSKLRFFRSKSEFVCLKYITFVSPREY